MKNKKGVEWDVIFGLVVMVIVLIAAGYFFVTKFSKGTSTLSKYEKSDVEALIQSCNLVSTPYGFCEDWKTVTSSKGETNYVNCAWGELKGITSTVACSDLSSLRSKKCADLTAEGKNMKNILVNGVAC